jgi:IS30 family transposase
LSKSKTITGQQRKAIRTYVKQGLGSNKIQKKLQKRHLGIRRKVLLAEIRKAKGQKPKANPYKYTPRKYRKRKTTYPSQARRQLYSGHQIAGYGTVHGQSRRIQVYGSGKQLYKIMLLASHHPPKTRFLTIDASKLLNNPWRYLSREEFWDAKPRVDS